MTTDPARVTAGDVEPFLEGWAMKPSPERVVAALRGADEVALAWEGVDLCCDDDVVRFYERLGFARVNGMVLRRPEVLP